MWYDQFARIYDRSLEDLYRPHREALAAALPADLGVIVDVPTGTGQGWPTLLPLLRDDGVLVGVDVSPGMLRHAAHRRDSLADPRIRLVEADATTLDPEHLALPAPADLVVSTLGLTVVPDPAAVVQACWALLRPGGTLAVLDAHAARRVPQTCIVEWMARADLRRRPWEHLEALGHTHTRWLGVSPHTFGGDLFVATVTKPM